MFKTTQDLSTFEIKEKSLKQKEMGYLGGKVKYTIPLCTLTQNCAIAPITLSDEKCVSAHGSFVVGISMDTLLESARTLSSFTMTGLGQWAPVTDD